MNEQNIMKHDTLLPEDFTGVFQFTNWTEEEFVGVWGKKEYHFPAKSMSPMLMYEYTPYEVQYIRKKFAKDLAEREFFKGRMYETMRLREGERDELGMIKPRGQGMSHAGQYSVDTLTPFIQKCLEPLEIKKATVTPAPIIPIEEVLTRNDEGELNTEPVNPKQSLKEKALKAGAK